MSAFRASRAVPQVRQVSRWSIMHISLCPSTFNGKFKFHQRRSIHSEAVSTNLRMILDVNQPLTTRMSGLGHITSLTTQGNADAEDALHSVLSTEDLDNLLHEAAAEGLRSGWSCACGTDIKATFQDGMTFLNSEDFEKAVCIFSQVIEQDPEYVEGWNQRAAARLGLKDFDGAIDDCLQALKLKPRHFECLAKLGYSFYHKGDEKAAIDSFNTALKVHPRLEVARQVIEGKQRRDKADQHLQNRILELVKVLKEGQDLEVRGKDEHIKSSIEVHRVAHDSLWTYLVRVRSVNLPRGEESLRSIARFYALQFATNEVFAVTRTTDTKDASFSLAPGEDHRYAFLLTVGAELLQAAGGIVLESESTVVLDGESTSPLLVDTTMVPAMPATEIASSHDVERFKVGYTYLGHLQMPDLGKV